MALENTVWSIYIIETRLGHWYTGISTDINARFEAHKNGKGAKNLKGKSPLTLIFSMEVGNKSAASKLEWQVKKLTKIKKRQWVASGGADNSVFTKREIKSTVE